MKKKDYFTNLYNEIKADKVSKSVYSFLYMIVKRNFTKEQFDEYIVKIKNNEVSLEDFLKTFNA